jgi:hypothetical protein
MRKGGERIRGSRRESRRICRILIDRVLTQVVSFRT